MTKVHFLYNLHISVNFKEIYMEKNAKNGKNSNKYLKIQEILKVVKRWERKILLIEL